MKKKSKSNVYFYVVVVCAAISVFLIAMMLFSDNGLLNAGKKPDMTVRPPSQSTAPQTSAPATKEPQTGKKDQQTVLTDKDAAAMINAKLGKAYPISNIGVHFKADGGLQITAMLSKDKLKSYMQEDGVALTTAQSLFFAVMPSDTNVSGDCTLSVEPESGLLNLTPGAVRLEGKEVPLGILPSGIFDELSEAVNGALVDSGYYFTSIEFGDGKIILKP